MMLLALSYEADAMFAQFAYIRSSKVNAERLMDTFMEQGSNSLYDSEQLAAFEKNLALYARYREKEIAAVVRNLLAGNFSQGDGLHGPDFWGRYTLHCKVVGTASDACVYDSLFSGQYYPNSLIPDETIIHFKNQTSVIFPQQNEMLGMQFERQIFKGRFRVLIDRRIGAYARAFSHILILMLAPASELEVLLFDRTEVRQLFAGMAADYSPYLLAQTPRSCEFSALDKVQDYMEQHEDDFHNFILTSGLECGRIKKLNAYVIDARQGVVQSCTDLGLPELPIKKYWAEHLRNMRAKGDIHQCMNRLAGASLRFFRLFQEFGTEGNLSLFLTQQASEILSSLAARELVFTAMLRSSKNLDDALTNYIVAPVFNGTEYVGVVAQSFNIDQLVQLLASKRQELIMGDFFLAGKDVVYYLSNQKLSNDMLGTGKYLFNDQYDLNASTVEARSMSLYKIQLQPLRCAELLINNVPLSEINENMSRYEQSVLLVKESEVNATYYDSESACISHTNSTQYAAIVLQSHLLNNGMTLLFALSENQFTDKSHAFLLVSFETSHYNYEAYFQCETFSQITGLDRCLDDFLDKASIKLPNQLLDLYIDQKQAAPALLRNYRKIISRVTASDLIGKTSAFTVSDNTDGARVDITFPQHLVYQLNYLFLFAVLGYNNLDLPSIDQISVRSDAYHYCTFWTSLGIYICIGERPSLAFYDVFSSTQGMYFQSTYSISHAAKNDVISCPREQTLNMLHQKVDSLTMHLSDLVRSQSAVSADFHRDEGLITLVPISRMYKTFAFQIITSYNFAKYDYFWSDGAFKNKVLLNAYAFIIFHPQLAEITYYQRVTLAFFFDTQVCQRLFFNLDMARALFDAGALNFTIRQYSQQFCVGFEISLREQEVAFKFRGDDCKIRKISKTSLYEITGAQFLGLPNSPYPCFNDVSEVDQFVAELLREKQQCTVNGKFEQQEEKSQGHVISNIISYSTAQLFRKLFLLFLLCAVIVAYFACVFPSRCC